MTRALPGPWPSRRRAARLTSRTARAFEQHEVDKEYGALVVGAVASGTVDAPIDGSPSTTVVTARGQTPCAVDGVLTDVALKPVTGRRHQLRRHCAGSDAHPSSGDDLYGGRRKGIGLFLYCRRLAACATAARGGRGVSCEIDEPRRFGRHRAKARKGCRLGASTANHARCLLAAGSMVAPPPAPRPGGRPAPAAWRSAMSARSEVLDVARRLGAERGRLLLDLGHLGVREDLPLWDGGGGARGDRMRAGRRMR